MFRQKLKFHSFHNGVLLISNKRISNMMIIHYTTRMFYVVMVLDKTKDIQHESSFAKIKSKREYYG